MSKFNCLSFYSQNLAYVVIFAALNLLCSASLFAAVDESQARKMGEATVKKVIPRKMDYQKLKFSFMPFGVTVNHITFSENPHFAKHPLRDWPYFARAEEIRLQAELLPLFIGRISVLDLAINNFNANILIDSDYSLNVDDLRQQKRGTLINWLRIKNFHASNGVVRIVDASAANPPARLVFDDIDLKFSGFAVKEKFNINLGLRTPSSKTRNVSLIGMAGPLDMKRSERMPLDGLLTVDKAPILPFLAYAPKGLTAYPISGDASMKLQLKGNSWDGMSSKGGIVFNNLVMAAPDGTQRGKAFTVGLDIGRNVFSLKSGRLDINDMAMFLDGQRMTVDGAVTGLPRKPMMDVNIQATRIEPTKMEDIYPFVRAYLPKGLAYSGTTSINIHAQGNVDGMSATGTMDSSLMGVALPEVFEKKAGSSLKVDFKADLVPSQFTIKAKANVLAQNIKMLNARLFRDGLREVLGNRISARQLDAIFKPTNTLTIGQAAGIMHYQNNFIRVEKMNLTQLSDAESYVTDAVINGTLDINKLWVDWSVDGRLSLERSQKLIKAAPSLATLADADGRILFDFKVTGALDKELRVSLK
ncbi:MAG: DUF748 domain-containing protein [Moraxellaceae bacterium]|nr:DUF748 domain-containing protein [Moraxellaceae bacterium]